VFRRSPIIFIGLIIGNCTTATVCPVQLRSRSDLRKAGNEKIALESSLQGHRRDRSCSKKGGTERSGVNRWSKNDPIGPALSISSKVLTRAQQKRERDLQALCNESLIDFDVCECSRTLERALIGKDQKRERFYRFVFRRECRSGASPKHVNL
jgi:hypothetical protein